MQPPQREPYALRFSALDFDQSRNPATLAWFTETHKKVRLYELPSAEFRKGRNKCAGGSFSLFRYRLFITDRITS